MSGRHLPSPEVAIRELQRISDAALASLSMDELLRELLDRVVDALGVDSAAVVLTGEGGRTVARAAGATDAEPRDGADAVFVVQENRVEQRAVKLGGDVGKFKLVTSGLKAGETVVVSPPAELKQGSTVVNKE